MVSRMIPIGAAKKRTIGGRSRRLERRAGIDRPELDRLLDRRCRADAENRAAETGFRNASPNDPPISPTPTMATDSSIRWSGPPP